MTSAKRLHYTYDQYLEVLSRSDFKLEYCDGVIYAMAGGTIAHGALAAAAIRVLGQALLGECTVYSSDVRVRIDATGLTTFPDASVVCGEVEASPADRHAIVNPTIIVEVTSRSTEDYDRGDKLSNYKQLPSLRAVLFISHRTPSVTIVSRDIVSRDGKVWTERIVRSGEHVALTALPPLTAPPPLPAPPLRFAVDDLYAGISLDAE